jgi:hypothetical protein
LTGNVEKGAQVGTQSDKPNGRSPFAQALERQCKFGKRTVIEVIDIFEVDADEVAWRAAGLDHGIDHA